tara:strand:+ start:311 stop:2008 length:1698 start_codon:yes stop_codon:yes gene_type:complete
MKELEVIDFFCGAGGFSEGFRQMGFKIVYGYDNWSPAIKTYNHNFELNCVTNDILKMSLDQIEKLPDTDIILGSPPCVSFSSSNKSGNADKTLGVQLTETFFRIIAVKKHKPNSQLKAWFMENVVNSRKFLRESYTFEDLDLSEWATRNNFLPIETAINVTDNAQIINSADYGAFQARKRVITGEISSQNKLIIPVKTHSDKVIAGLKPHRSIYSFKRVFPSPFENQSTKRISDPQYPIELPQDIISDHFYDTGIYETVWNLSKYYKINHPYMGKMSFPENELKPSRTITSTKISGSRESIIYKSEYVRSGNGEYRIPTVREAAIIMGFPITYQFLASESSKWRMIGNAVCCSVSKALALTVLVELDYKIPPLHITPLPNLLDVLNLNDYKLKIFDNQPKKSKGARFRRHAIKDGNLTVSLSNYSIIQNETVASDNWHTSIQYGTGKGFPSQPVADFCFQEVQNEIKHHTGGAEFLRIMNSEFSNKIGSSHKLQKLYENQISSGNTLEPTILVEEIRKILESLKIENLVFSQTDKLYFKHKKDVPLKQLYALYAINKISSIANTN